MENQVNEKMVVILNSRDKEKVEQERKSYHSEIIWLSSEQFLRICKTARLLI